jgi:hypothetical protein
METIHFKKSGEALFVKFTVKGGVLAAAYTLTLISADGLKEEGKYSGDNRQVDDDKFQLPKPAAMNDGRVIRCTVDFKGLDLTMSPTYDIAIEIYQGSQSLGLAEAKGTLATDDQDELIFVKLQGE